MERTGLPAGKADPRRELHGARASWAAAGAPRPMLGPGALSRPSPRAADGVSHYAPYRTAMGVRVVGAPGTDVGVAGGRVPVGLGVADPDEAALPGVGGAAHPPHPQRGRGEGREWGAEAELQGVTLIIAPRFDCVVQEVRPYSGRLVTVTIDTAEAPLKIIAIYAPQRETWWEEVEKIIEETPASTDLLLVGDFNAQTHWSPTDRWGQSIR